MGVGLGEVEPLGRGAMVARKMKTLMKTFWLGQSLRTY